MAKTTATKERAKRPSSVRPARAVQRDRSKRPAVAPSTPAMQARLSEVVGPATYAQTAAYQAQGLRARALSLPVMTAFLLNLIWRQLGSVREAVRVLQTEGLLWAEPVKVPPQAVGQRLLTLPTSLFERLLTDMLPLMRAAGAARPAPSLAISRAERRFPAILALDGSTLDGLLCKVGQLQGGEQPVLAGSMPAPLDVVSHLPRQVQHEEESTAYDQRFCPRVLANVTARTLLIFDLSFLHYACFDQLPARQARFITRAAKDMATQQVRVLQATSALHDQVVWVGRSMERRCEQPLRPVAVLQQGKWYRYLTNALDPASLPAGYAVALYWQRWRIEAAFAAVKRVLGLANFWTGAPNGSQAQLWATWLLYAVLVDLTDGVAGRLSQLFQALSLEMVYRGLCHFTQAAAHGDAETPWPTSRSTPSARAS